MLVEEKLTKLGLKLPNAPAPEGVYIGAKLYGKLVITCGQNPFITTKRGFIGNDLTLEEGYIAAQETCLNCLAQLKKLLGDLDRIKQVLQVVSFINSIDEFMDQDKVMNGFTDLILNLYGEINGKPTCASIPIHQTGLEAIEAWMVVEIK